MVERLTGMRLRDYLRERVFRPLEMNDTVLGLPDDGMARLAFSLDAPFSSDSNDVGTDWNTPYWRDFGAPWGGLHSTVDDLSRFLSHMLGEADGPLSPSLRRAMTADQTARLPLLPAADKLTNRWGLGWAIGSPHFGSLVSQETFGHRGATGALFWADPRTGLSCVLLTNQPRLWTEERCEFIDLPARYSNAVASACVAE